MPRRFWRETAATIVILAFDLFMLLSIPEHVHVFSEATTFNSRSMPYLVTILIALCCLWDLISTWCKMKKESAADESMQTSLFDKAGLIRVCIGVLAIAVWMLVLKTIGFMIATILLAVVMMILMGNNSKLQIIVTSVLLSLVIYLIFKEGLGLRLPRGLFFF